MMDTNNSKTKKRQADSTLQEEYVRSLKILAEIQEKQNKDLASCLHSELIPYIISSKTKLWLHCKDVLKEKFSPDVMEHELQHLNQLSKRLRELMNELYPSVLDRYGPVQAFHAHIRDLKETRNTVVHLKCDESLLKRSFPDQIAIHLFRLLEASLNYFQSQNEGETITVFIYPKGRNIIVDFLKKQKEPLGDADIETPNSDFSLVQARLLILNAKINKESNWIDFTQIVIPPHSINVL